eukprot:TRINITY_DN3133_c0_g1_i1.p2 TRINITY_DN3133_c0_g1~~TRINITY_DN3133_c0_g1_i1.p2  ORF type:complete len:150 (-),score=18.75 TRINITY_DN3133_c0_g1_i1:518-946(-)
MQCLFYLSMGILLVLLDKVSGQALSLDQLFSSDGLDLRGQYGWVVCSAYLMASLSCAGFLVLIVERAKKCLDFAVTTFFVHLLLCCLWAGFPKSWIWWGINVLAVVVTAVVGEYFCMRRQLHEIPLHNPTPKQRSNLPVTVI